MKKFMSLLMGASLIMGGVPAVAKTADPSNVHMTVVFKDNKIPSDVTNMLGKSGAKVLKNFPNIGAIEISGSADLISTLQKNTAVQAVSPTMIQHLPKVKTVAFNPQDAQTLLKQQTSNGDASNLSKAEDNEPEIIGEDPFPPDYPLLHHFYQWDIKRVTNNGESYKVEKGNHDVVVGIIDTGVDKDHPDLAGNLLGGRNYVPAGGEDGMDNTETGDPTDFEDRNGHGSHVAGTIAGNGQILGVAPEVGFKAYRVFGAESGASTATVADAIVGATDDGVDVISMSLSGYSVLGQTMWTDPSTGKTYKLGNEVADFLLYKRAVKYATDHGVTVVAAAGNDNINITNKAAVTDFLNQEYGSQGYKFIGAAMQGPGSMPGVITVSATGPDDQRASYSNYGAGFVDISAPGGDAERYPNWSWYEDLALGAYMEDSYIFMAGTSMATPKVSAVAALIIAQEGNIGPEKVAQKVKETADEVGQVGKDVYYGAGMVQAPHQSMELPANVEWQKHFGGLSKDGAMKVLQTKDGGYLTLGDTYSYTKEENSDLYLVKTYPDGRIQWRQSMYKTGEDYPVDMKETKDGGYLLLSFNYVLGSHGREFFMYLTKINENGQVEWEKKMDGNNKGFSSLFIQEDGYVISGASQGDAMLMKLDLTGKVVWEKTYGSDADDNTNIVKPTPDGGYIVGGYTFSGPATHKKDFYLFKVSGAGELEWEKMYGKGDFIYESISDIEPTPDGGFIVIGAESTEVWGGFIRNEVPSIYYAKMSPTGDIIWSKTIGEADSYEEATSLLATKDGNYMLAGSYERGELNKDVYLLKFNENGDTISEQFIGGDLSDFATDIQETRDGGYIITGNTKSYVNGFKEAYGMSGDRDVYLVKLK
ncbi:S8 family serine peptidase [Bacillus sp. CGMCC 1.16607]|uniref:S8 family peptidase n=1 Tax=Bacillus sp. CGMCC 1.16607 TaxID=3351842 RepID=UPI003636CCFD